MEKATEKGQDGVNGCGPDDAAVRAIRAMVREDQTQSAAVPEPERGHPAPAQNAAADETASDEARPPSAASKGSGRRAAVAQATQAIRLLARFSWHLLRHPHTPKVVAGLGVGALILWHPFGMLAVAFLALLVAAITYLSVGPETVDAFILRRFAALKRRDPARAERLYDRTVRVIAVLNQGLDRLPERWTAGLYLPDLEEPGPPPEKLFEDPFERLEPVPGATPEIRRAHPSLPDPSDRLRDRGATPQLPPRRIRPSGDP